MCPVGLSWPSAASLLSLGGRAAQGCALGAPAAQEHTQATHMASYLSLSPAYTIHMINCLHCSPYAHKVAVTCWVVSVCTITSLGQRSYLCFVLEGTQLALKHSTGSQEMIQMEKQKHDLPGLDSISLSVLCSNQIRLARIERSDCLETVW